MSWLRPSVLLGKRAGLALGLRNLYIINIVTEHICNFIQYYRKIRQILILSSCPDIHNKFIRRLIYRTIILPVVLYGCETWSLTLREERRLRVLRRVLDLRGTR